MAILIADMTGIAITLMANGVMMPATQVSAYINARLGR